MDRSSGTTRVVSPETRLPRVGVVAPPKRTAARRTVAAIAEDLAHARKVGGLWQTTEAHLAATLDCLSLADGPASEQSLARARDLLVSYVRRGCELHRTAHSGDKTSLAAAESLQTLLLRHPTDTSLAVVIRRKAVVRKDVLGDLLDDLVFPMPHSISRDGVVDGIACYGEGTMNHSRSKRRSIDWCL